MNVPYRLGERYLCFVVVKEDGGYGGLWTRWQCEECGYWIAGDLAGWLKKQLADHHECGHAPCAKCGQTLLRRKDGTPRQHAHNRCPGKTPGDKIEREFVKHMTAREYA